MIRKRVYLPIRSRLLISTSNRAPARSLLPWIARIRRVFRPFSRVLRRKGQLRPRHRVVTLEQTGARTASSLIRAPVLVNRPASRTRGNGLSRGSVKGRGSTYSGDPAAISTTRLRTVVRPFLSVARKLTL